jgi:heat shock protein HslJ
MRAMISIAVVSVLALSGCVAVPAGRIVEPRGAPGFEGQWRLIDGTDGGGPLDLDGTSVTLTVDGDTFFGDGPCNSYRGTVDESVRAVDFSVLAFTERGCMEAQLGVLEARYFAGLDSVGSGGLTGERLSLSGKSGPLTHSRVRLVFESLD